MFAIGPGCPASEPPGAAGTLRNPHLMSLGEKQSPPSPHETENVQLGWGAGARLVHQRHM